MSEWLRGRRSGAEAVHRRVAEGRRLLTRLRGDRVQRSRWRLRLRPRVAARMLASALRPSSGAVLHVMLFGDPLRPLQQHGSGGRGERSPCDNMPLNKGRCHLRLDRAQHRCRTSAFVGHGCRPPRLLRQAGRGPQHVRGERPFGRLQLLRRRRCSLTVSLGGVSALVHRKTSSDSLRWSHVAAGRRTGHGCVTGRKDSLWTRLGRQSSCRPPQRRTPGTRCTRRRCTGHGAAGNLAEGRVAEQVVLIEPSDEPGPGRDGSSARRRTRYRRRAR
jgi:hypothetical protein